jgi:hypothetical protein
VRFVGPVTHAVLRVNWLRPEESFGRLNMRQGCCEI